MPEKRPCSKCLGNVQKMAEIWHYNTYVLLYYSITVCCSASNTYVFFFCIITIFLSIFYITSRDWL